MVEFVFLNGGEFEWTFAYYRCKIIVVFFDFGFSDLISDEFFFVYIWSVFLDFGHILDIFRLATTRNPGIENTSV